MRYTNLSILQKRTRYIHYKYGTTICLPAAGCWASVVNLAGNAGVII